jgi:hypothetical protein
MLPLIAGIVAGCIRRSTASRRYGSAGIRAGAAQAIRGECQLPDGKTIDEGFPTA